ncbi:hypothetical protein BJ508DRAFT_334065 [Ascobolus immersus RN42]|uniref:Uncharacterized protein n=1 Tax=Ascobolus immersus RN42 TaxID=1160509 RepID=A0A3N4HHI4_ASCIM|nr:hypothetical protein BJ508DRAFT_334065 [Ascobolus immersus RN42]
MRPADRKLLRGVLRSIGISKSCFECNRPENNHSPICGTLCTGVDVPVTITAFRAADMNFYCPVAFCGFRHDEKAEFKHHVEKGHPVTGVLKREAREALAPGSQMLCYKPVLDQDGLLSPPPLSPLKIDPTPATKAPKAPPTSNGSTKPQIVTNTSIPPVTGNTQATTAPASMQSKVSSITTTRVEEVRAALVAEFKRQVQEDFWKTLKDPNSDYEESSNRREEFKRWFDEGMRILREADDADLEYA